MHDDGNAWINAWITGGPALWVILSSVLLTLLYFVVTTVFGHRIRHRDQSEEDVWGY